MCGVCLGEGGDLTVLIKLCEEYWIRVRARETETETDWLNQGKITVTERE